MTIDTDESLHSRIAEACALAKTARFPTADYDAVVARVRGVVKGFAMTGSKGIWCGSDVDVRFDGSADPTDFVEELSDLYDACGGEKRVWKCKNLCTFTVGAVKVDALFPGWAGAEACMQKKPATETQVAVQQEFNDCILQKRLGTVPFDARKTAALAALCDLVASSPDHRAMVGVLKLLDPDAPTCFVTLAVAVAASAVQECDRPRAWCVSMEVVAQFMWRFSRCHAAETHIAYSFFDEIWRPFHKKHLLAAAGISLHDPLGSLFPITSPQHSRVHQSRLVHSLTPAGSGYALRIDGPPVFLGSPRPLPPVVLRSVTDYVLVTSGGFADTRLIATEIHGFNKRAAAMCAPAFGKKRDALSAFTATGGEFTAEVLALLHARVG